MYFGDLYNDAKKYEKATGGKHGFESAANISESVLLNLSDDQFAQQLCDIAIAATADKEHIQQMTNCTDDLLAVIKQQQEQITELLRQNGILIGKAGAGGSALSAATQAATKNAANAAAKIAANAAAKANTAAIAAATLFD